MTSKYSFQGIQVPEPFPFFSGIEEISRPERVVISMYQQPGSVCDPMVQVGDHVKKGQIIGSSDQFGTAPIHASVSGTVAAIGKTLEPTGRKVDSITIDSDGKDEWAEGIEFGDLLPMIGSGKLKVALESAGIVEAGVPSFPLVSRIYPRESTVEVEGVPSAQKGKILIINAFDIEPGVMVRRAALENKIEEVIAGIKLLQQAVALRNSVVAVNPTFPLSERVSDALARQDISIFEASPKYPSALEPMLVKQITGREIPLPDGSGADVGAFVFDVLTTLNVLEAVRSNKPQTEKLITVMASTKETPINVLVPIGTSIRSIMESYEISPDAGKVILGGHMMGIAHYTLDVPVTKQTYSVIFQPGQEVVEFQPEPCIDCGACVRACPTNLMANILGRVCEYNMFAEAEKNHIFHCIECGLCAYVCPARRPMVQFIKLGKRELLAKRTGA